MRKERSATKKSLPSKIAESGKSSTLRAAMRKALMSFSNFIQSPISNVAMLIAIILCVFAGGRLLSKRPNPAQLSFVEHTEPDGILPDDSNLMTAFVPEIFAGEVYDTAVRLKETAALGMAISLVVFAEYSDQKRPPSTLKDILTAISQRNMVPPGFSIGEPDVSTPSSLLLIRYQSRPLRFEIVSIPKAGIKGPIVMLQFPLASMSGQTVPYYQSATTARSDIPTPFASPDQIVGSGWTLEQWRGELLPLKDDTVQALSEEQSEWNAKNR